MEYQKLRDLLAQGKWKEADEETWQVILKVANREEEGYLNIEHIDNFPCENLRTIDQLWVKYSDGQFGFSVQKKIYQSLGGTREYNEKIWNAFGEKVGWRKAEEWLIYIDLTFDTTAESGHLPRGAAPQLGIWGLVFGGWDGRCIWRGGWWSFYLLLSKLVNCDI